MGLRSVGEFMDRPILLQNVCEGNLASNIADVVYLPACRPVELRTELQPVPDVFVDDIYLWSLLSEAQVAQTNAGGSTVSAAGAIGKAFLAGIRAHAASAELRADCLHMSVQRQW